MVYLVAALAYWSTRCMTRTTVVLRLVVRRLGMERDWSLSDL